MKLNEYLATCRELAGFCTQNGWIDNDTLSVDVLERSDRALVAAVTFDEVVMEGSGCVADRVSCYGRVRVLLDPSGDVQDLKLL
ncbi:MAG: hypothetical protein B7Z66_02175 [Chromatiales bacterium 21-64-14]|nr:MAG: hypothetical protein B7Z66_02175 [Chromatiales bacterium 21-64-14]HQU16491.1 hypothetical protein [Gammaproteobacteria bacterium]